MEKRGYDLSFIVKKLGKHELSSYEWCVNKRVDGSSLSATTNHKGLYELIESDIPCVSTDMLLKGLHTIISDNVLESRSRSSISGMS